MNGKALRKHSMHEKTAASVLLKLFMLMLMFTLSSYFKTQMMYFLT